MLEGFHSSHPPSWTAQNIDHSTTQEQHRINNLRHSLLPGGQAALRGRAYTTGKADPTSDLFVSLDFLHQSNDEEKARGRIGLEHGKAIVNHRISPGSAFWDSPDLDSSSASSEQDWRRSFASDTDPVHKRGNRSRSRETPGAASSPSRDRSLSTSKLPQQRSIHPWATDTSSPLRQTVDFVESNGSARWLDIGQGGQRDPIKAQHNSNGNTQNYNSMAPTNNISPQSHLMSSSSSGQARTGLASSPPYLATMQEEAWDANYPFRNNEPNDLRSTVRNRSTSSAAALQQVDRSMAQRGNSSDTFSRSISIWKGEYGGMSPNTYASRNAFREDSPPFTSGLSQSQSHAQSQWERGRRGDYNGPVFDTFSEEEDLRELGGAGTESRRHSIAADPASTTLIGQRRAIGFEVGRPHPSSTSRTSSVGRPGGLPANDLKPFSGGGLAITEDDLSFDLHNLNLDFNGIDIHRQQQEDRRRINARIPSTNAAVTGAHASSVPMAFNGKEFSPPMKESKWPISAGFRDDDIKTSWSDMVSSPGTNSSIQDPFLQAQSQQDDRKKALSATAKVFQGSSALNFGTTTSNGTSVQSQAFNQKPFTGSAFNASRQPQLEKSPPIGTSSPPSKAFPTFDRPINNLQQQSTLSDTAIASLVTLGPLAPSSSGQSDTQSGGNNLQELGKGVPLQMLPRSTTLYIVEFKEGRTDLYFRQQQGPQEEIRKGDLVIVEADRGKDLGTVVNDSITVDQVQSFLSHQAELSQPSNGQHQQQSHINNGEAAVPHPAAVALSRMSRSINPKRLFSKASPGDTTLLHAKAQDEERALALCTTKVNQRGLPMTVVAAELQWDRRKLTFYYTASQRVDFRELVKELFRLYKVRIHMWRIQ